MCNKSKSIAKGENGMKNSSNNNNNGNKSKKRSWFFKIFRRKQQVEVPQEDEATKKFNARFLISQEIKKQKKTITIIQNMVQDLMKKAWGAKQSGNESIYKMRLKQIGVAEARKKQSEMFIAQTEALMDVQTLNEQSKGIYIAIEEINKAFGVLGLDEESVAKNQMMVERGVAGLDKQNELLEQTMDAMAFSLGGTEDFSGEELELERRIEEMMDLEIEAPAGVNQDTQKIMQDASILN